MKFSYSIFYLHYVLPTTKVATLERYVFKRPPVNLNFPGVYELRMFLLKISRIAVDKKNEKKRKIVNNFSLLWTTHKMHISRAAAPLLRNCSHQFDSYFMKLSFKSD